MLHRLLIRIALAVTALKRRTQSDIGSVLISFYHDGKSIRGHTFHLSFDYAICFRMSISPS